MHKPDFTRWRRPAHVCSLIVMGCAIWLLSPGQATAQVWNNGGEPVSKMLNTWFSEGSAAGLNEINYENRDGGHSPFPTGEWPQLKVYTPPSEEKDRKQLTGPALFVRQMVLFGNSSMAAPPDRGGCLPRIYATSNGGMGFVTSQYLDNNLFFYPSHLDHNVGWNGVGGYGDLFPLNSSCMVVSQGSSFTDQPFLRAFMAATAALPPDTQHALIKTRMLMPTLQSLFRRSNKQVKKEEDYFTGAAHPPVFRGDQIDMEKFALLAHNLTQLAVPPVPLLQVVHETPVALPGRDFFELPQVTSESFADTPCVVSRIFRVAQFKHEMVVSARRSADLERRTPAFKWVLLQGDPKHVRITPDSDGLQAKIEVEWQPEMVLPDGLASHRVDIGVFAGNGLSWSAPAFITFYMLPNEGRFYGANGRLEEICYEAGNPDAGLPASNDLRWLSLGHRLFADMKSAGVQALLQVLPEEAITALMKAANDLESKQRAWRTLNADASKKKEADAALQVLRDETQRRIDAPLKDGKSARIWMGKAIHAIADTSDLFVSLQERLTALAAEAGKKDELIEARDRAVAYRVLEETRPGFYSLYSKPKDLTAGERAQLHTLHLTVLATALLPDFLERSNKPAWVDPRLSFPKSWRDVYVYDKNGELLGWTRITNGRAYEFDSIGRLMPEGRKGKAVEVNYTRNSSGDHLIFAAK